MCKAGCAEILSLSKIAGHYAGTAARDKVQADAPAMRGNTKQRRRLTHRELHVTMVCELPFATPRPLHQGGSENTPLCSLYGRYVPVFSEQEGATQGRHSNPGISGRAIVAAQGQLAGLSDGQPGSGLPWIPIFQGKNHVAEKPLAADEAQGKENPLLYRETRRESPATRCGSCYELRRMAQRNRYQRLLCEIHKAVHQFQEVKGGYQA